MVEVEMAAVAAKVVGKEEMVAEAAEVETVVAAVEAVDAPCSTCS